MTYQYGFIMRWRHGGQASIKLMYSTPNSNMCIAEWFIDQADTAEPRIARFHKYNAKLIPAEMYSYTAKQLLDWHKYLNPGKSNAKNKTIAERQWRERNWDEGFFHN